MLTVKIDETHCHYLTVNSLNLVLLQTLLFVCPLHENNHEISDLSMFLMYPLEH